MSSSLALEYGKYYHIYNRGNNRENIFREEKNYLYFLQLYSKYIPFIADTYSYCLMPNHFHLLVRIKTEKEQAETLSKTLRVSTIKTPHQTLPKNSIRNSETLRVSTPFKLKNPSQQFGNLCNAYTKAINNMYQRTGSLFENPFNRKEVSSEAYFKKLIIYTHRNPQKHGFVDDFREWAYSSYHPLFSIQPTQLKRTEVLSWFEGEDVAEAHEKELTADEMKVLGAEDFI